MSAVDVAIVGAGPAGAWTAYRLARAGARVALIDPSHPREKPCGGGVTGRALALLAGALPNGFPAVTIRSARLIDPETGCSAVVPLEPHSGSEPGAVVVASRAAFDGALLEAAVHAGATLITSRATDIVVHRRGVSVETTGDLCQAAVIVGADGANSLVRRRVARAFPRHQLSIATGFFARNLSSDQIILEIVASPPGYIWSFPRPDHLAIGMCAQADAGVRADVLRRATADWMRSRRVGERAPLDAYAWPIPSLDADALGALRVSGPRWCVVGDAAGLVDPITREGIYFAIRSAGHAADAIASGRLDWEDDYAARVHDEELPELIRAARLKAGFFRPGFVKLMTQALNQSEKVRQVMADLIAGRQSYAGLRRQLLKTCEVGLASRLVANQIKSMVEHLSPFLREDS